jgi:hypothetical protein
MTISKTMNIMCGISTKTFVQITLLRGMLNGREMLQLPFEFTYYYIIKIKYEKMTMTKI